jgi:hypothetical protein
MRHHLLPVDRAEQIQAMAIQNKYPRELIRTFVVGVILATIGTVAGFIYMFLHTYFFAVAGSLAFAMGSCAIAAALLLGEQYQKDTRL